MSESVKNMFSLVAKKYDLLNALMSFGTHNSWRKKAVKLSGAKSGMSVLDCASGTGDFAIEFAKVTGSIGKVTAQDFCKEMLDYIKPKSQKHNFNIEVSVGDVMNLEFEDNTFDIASIGFGIRNVDDPIKGLSEMTRVVKNGGKIIILETGQPEGFFKYPFKLYSNIIIPLLGLIVAGNISAYKYFKDTASKFPYGDNFVELLKKTGNVKTCRYYPQVFGVSYIYIGEVNK